MECASGASGTQIRRTVLRSRTESETVSVGAAAKGVCKLRDRVAVTVARTLADFALESVFATGSAGERSGACCIQQGC